MGLFEEVSERVGRHFGLLGFRRQTGSVKVCNDDDEVNCLGKGGMRVPGAFGDSFKSIESHNGNSGFGHLFRVQFKLDFHFRASKKGWELTII
jgi:hypothetical protein